MTAVFPVPERPFVRENGILTTEGRDFLQGILLRTGGVGTVTLTQSEIVGSVENELVKFNATGQLTNSGVSSVSSGITAPGAVLGLGLLGRASAVINFSDLSLAASEAVFPITSGSWQVTDIFLSGHGTDFAGGDRNLDVVAGSAVYSTVPAATLQALATGRWGSAGVPFPALASDLLVNATSSIAVRYSGGATDYTSGQCTVIIVAERVV